MSEPTTEAGRHLLGVICGMDPQGLYPPGPDELVLAVEAEMLVEINRLRRQNHDAAVAADRRLAALQSQVDRERAARERAIEAVRGSPVDWTNDRGSTEPNGWWRYTSQQNQNILTAAVLGVRATLLAELRAKVEAIRAGQYDEAGYQAVAEVLELLDAEKP